MTSEWIEAIRQCHDEEALTAILSAKKRLSKEEALRSASSRETKLGLTGEHRKSYTNMKTMYIFLGASAASLIIMVVVDFIMGPEAEFLNAYSVFQRLLGQQPSIGESVVAQKLGALGEFVVVLAANLAVGGIVTAIVRLFIKQ